MAIVRLRYLAAVLRLADALAFDPEFLPETILRHPSSDNLVDWWKNLEIIIYPNEETNQFALFARLPVCPLHTFIGQWKW